MGWSALDLSLLNTSDKRYSTFASPSSRHHCLSTSLLSSTSLSFTLCNRSASACLPSVRRCFNSNSFLQWIPYSGKRRRWDDPGSIFLFFTQVTREIVGIEPPWPSHLLELVFELSPYRRRRHFTDSADSPYCFSLSFPWH